MAIADPSRRAQSGQVPHGPDSSYPTAVALPVVLIGIGQSLAFAPMTSAGLAGTDGRDAGAASGLVNTFHQLGSALGLGILVARRPSIGSWRPDGRGIGESPATGAVVGARA